MKSDSVIYAAAAGSGSFVDSVAVVDEVSIGAEVVGAPVALLHAVAVTVVSVKGAYAAESELVYESADGVQCEAELEVGAGAEVEAEVEVVVEVG